ncbi:hypothetical protein H6P81_004017 [Aristolochia fimbriata]|uniref:Uncharacterized protein n=1 Tax=Aristolochia fimbriata TaxID=158543 RepID=A0AAV7FEQ6_ARIFI|nr:hypothetical protein H6P81_004017 [Aristolochia fimbriata]
MGASRESEVDGASTLELQGSTLAASRVWEGQPLNKRKGRKCMLSSSTTTTTYCSTLFRHELTLSHESLINLHDDPLVVLLQRTLPEPDPGGDVAAVGKSPAEDAGVGEGEHHFNVGVPESDQESSRRADPEQSESRRDPDPPEPAPPPPIGGGRRRRCLCCVCGCGGGFEGGDLNAGVSASATAFGGGGRLAGIEADVAFPSPVSPETFHERTRVGAGMRP